jgi:hypothetical protein
MHHGAWQVQQTNEAIVPSHQQTVLIEHADALTDAFERGAHLRRQRTVLILGQQQKLA